MSYNITIEKRKSSVTEEDYYFSIYTQFGSNAEESYLEKYKDQWVFHDTSDQIRYRWEEVEIKSVHFGILSYCFSTLTNLTKSNTPKYLDNLEYGIVNNYSNTIVNFKGF